MPVHAELDEGLITMTKNEMLEHAISLLTREYAVLDALHSKLAKRFLHTSADSVLEDMARVVETRKYLRSLKD